MQQSSKESKLAQNLTYIFRAYLFYHVQVQKADKVDKVQPPPSAGAPEIQAKNNNNLTNLQILSCELHRNAFGGRVLPAIAGGVIALPRYTGR